GFPIMLLALLSVCKGTPLLPVGAIMDALGAGSQAAAGASAAAGGAVKAGVGIGVNAGAGLGALLGG
ncbi:hypothetical protein AVEN_35082-1, partial [Araneus ventricosus]